MAIVVMPDGSIRVDTKDELRLALAVQKEASQPMVVKPVQPTPPAPAVKDAERPPQPAAGIFQPHDQVVGFRKLFNELGDQPQQQALLRVLLAAPRPLSDADVRLALGLNSNFQLRGLLIGVARKANNRGLPGPIAKEMTRSDGGRKRNYRYAAIPALKRAMEGYAVQQTMAV